MKPEKREWKCYDEKDRMKRGSRSSQFFHDTNHQTLRFPNLDHQSFS